MYATRWSSDRGKDEMGPEMAATAAPTSPATKTSERILTRVHGSRPDPGGDEMIIEDGGDFIASLNQRTIWARYQGFLQIDITILLVREFPDKWHHQLWKGSELF